MIDRLRHWARLVKRDVLALWLAGRDPRVPWLAKALAVLVAAYAFSPIDLIPDVIPVLGLLDDAILLPLGVLLVVRMIPAPVMAELRAEAAKRIDRPVSRAGAMIIATLWLAAIGAAVWLCFR